MPTRQRITTIITVGCLLLAATTGSLLAEQPLGQRQWIVVTTATLRGALAPLIETRSRQGYRVTIIEVDPSSEDPETVAAEGLSEHITDRYEQFDGTSCVLLVGDWEKDAGDGCLPPHPGSHGRMLGKQTDHAYGRPGKDGAAAIAVGRFPARNASDLDSMVQKTLQFEQSKYGPWTNRLVLLGGNPGGRSLLEKRAAELAVQAAANKQMADLSPLWRITAVVDMPNAPYSVPPGKFGKAAMDALEAGQLFTFYAGHSGATGLWSNGGFVVLRDDFASCNITGSRGIFVTTGCYACQIRDDDGQGFAVFAFRNPSGPAAVIGSFAESYAALGLLAMDGVTGALNSQQPPATLGDYWLAVQSKMARGPIDPIKFWLYDQVDGSRGQVPLAEQRLEHLEMWTLLGDPGMKLPILRSTLELCVSGDLQPGGTLRIDAHAGRQHDNARVRVTAESRYAWSGQSAVAAGAELHSFGSIVGETEAVVTEGRIQCDLHLPVGLPNQDLTIRVVLLSQRDPVMGVHVVSMATPPSQ